MNCFKRAFIIFGSALVLGTGLHLGQVVGVALALAGLYMYSRAKKGQGGYKSSQTGRVLMFVSMIALVVSLKTAAERTVHGSRMGFEETPLTIRLRKLSANFNTIGGALPHVVRKAVMAHDLPDPLPPIIHYLWLHPIPLTDSALRNVIDLATHTNTVVHCGSNECEEQIEAMTQQGLAVASRALVAPEICGDTPLYRWTKKHVFYKLQAGPNYEKQLTQAIALCILYKLGGIYVDNNVTLAAKIDFAKMPEGPWISEQGLFHVSYFPPGQEVLIKLMIRYALQYPAWTHTGTQWPSVYDFTDLVEINSTKFEKVDAAALGFVSHPFTLPSNTRQYATMKYDLRNPSFGVNLGDEVQTFGGIQFLPHIDHFVTRDLLHTYKFDNNVTFFINAWIGDKHFDWPYQLFMDPVMVAVHLTNKRYTESDKKLQYLRSKAPIGARDMNTLKKLEEKRIPSYFSGCATILTQNPYKRAERSKKIYIVDVWYQNSKLMRILPDDIKADIVRVSHGPQFRGLGKFDNIGRFLYSADLVLEKYARARAVITQRIHAAMPAVGLGVPVIFVGNAGLPGGSADRLGGLTDMWHYFDMKNESEPQMKQRMKALFAHEGPKANPNPQMEHRIKNNLLSHILSRHAQELRNAAQMYGVIERDAHFDPMNLTVTNDNPPPPPDPGLMNVTYKDTRPH